MARRPDHGPLPVNLLTGFLGSGKTTLLQRLLDSPAFGDSAVLINEFGEVGLDHHLLRRIDDDMVMLQSGCICCTIRGELAEAIRDLHARRGRGEIPAFRRLVIESTGLADPVPILSTITSDPVLRHQFRLGNVITTVDAVNGTIHLDRQPESVKQAAVADRIVMTKTDLAEPDRIACLRARLARLNPAAAVIESAGRAIDPDFILARDLDDPVARAKEVTRWADAADHAHVHDDVNRHDARIRAFALTLRRPVNFTAFGLWLTLLLQARGDDILRVKGILNVVDTVDPVVIHSVQHVVHAPQHLADWPDGDRRSRIVFIVRDIERADVERSLKAFLALPDTLQAGAV